MEDEKVRTRIEELAREYSIDEDIIWKVYDIMPNELYDGIVDMLEEIRMGMF